MIKQKMLILLLLILNSPSYASVFWGDEAAKNGYVLPPTFGFSISGAGVHEVVDARNLNVNAPNSPLSKGEPDYINKFMKGAGLGVDSIKVKVVSKIARFDVWLFPFLDVYIVGGRTNGEAIASVSYDVNSPQAILLKSAGMEPQTTFNIYFDGPTYGGGAILAGGYKNFFTVINYTYVITDLNILSRSVMAEDISTNIGYRLTPKFNIWVGGNYENITQTALGPIPDGMVPSGVNKLLGKNAKFNADVRVRHSFNPLIAAQYMFTKYINFVVQGTFNNRDSILASLEYRF